MSELMARCRTAYAGLLAPRGSGLGCSRKLNICTLSSANPDVPHAMTGHIINSVVLCITHQ